MFLCFAVVSGHTEAWARCLACWWGRWAHPHLVVWHPTGAATSWRCHHPAWDTLRSTQFCSCWGQADLERSHLEQLFFPLWNTSEINIRSIITGNKHHLVALEKNEVPKVEQDSFPFFLSNLDFRGSPRNQQQQKRRVETQEGEQEHTRHNWTVFDISKLWRACAAIPFVAVVIRSCLILYWLCIWYLQSWCRLLEWFLEFTLHTHIWF